MEKKYRLELIGITYNQIESGVYAVILQQAGSNRRIPIIIGYPEAQAIECKLQEVVTPRPLTHDMMANFMSAFGISLTEVEIKKLPNGVFAADLHFTDGENERIVDSRSSDAIALAIRVGAPIYTSERVLEEAGFTPSESKEVKAEPSTEYAESLLDKEVAKNTDSIEELQRKMQKAAEVEDYEQAAKIREIIRNLQKNDSREKD